MQFDTVFALSVSCRVDWITANADGRAASILIWALTLMAEAFSETGVRYVLPFSLSAPLPFSFSHPAHELFELDSLRPYCCL